MTTRCREVIVAEKQAERNVVKACDLSKCPVPPSTPGTAVPSSERFLTPSSPRIPHRPHGQQGDLRGAQGARRTGRSRAPCRQKASGTAHGQSEPHGAVPPS